MDKTMKKSIIVISAILSTSIPGPASAQYYETYCEHDAWRNAVYRCASGGCNTKQTYANLIRQLYPSVYSDPYRVLFSEGSCEGKQNNGSFEKMKKEVQKGVRRELGIAEPKTPSQLKKEKEEAAENARFKRVDEAAKKEREEWLRKQNQLWKTLGDS